MKHLSLILALLLWLVACTPVQTADAKGTCGDNLKWSFNESTGVLTITGSGKMADFYGQAYYIPWYSYHENITAITLPQGLTSISHNAFRGCSELTGITIPDSVVQLEGNPFAFCTSLTDITVSLDHPALAVIDDVLFEKATKKLICYPAGKSQSSYAIPQGIQQIEDLAFSGCKTLTDITIPDSVTTIGGGAFSGCDSLTVIVIPNSVTTIGDWAFDYCKNLTSITLPDSLTTIGEYAFSGCDSLTSTNIPDGVIELGNNPFSYCSALTAISVSLDHPVLVVIDGVLFDKAAKKLICYPAGKSQSSYTIPQSVEEIGAFAFSICNSLTAVTIPDSVVSICKYAFYECESLTDIDIPDSVTTIGDWAFSECKSLTEIVIPDGVTSIGDHAFYKCTGLTSVTIPDSVTAIGDTYVFAECPNLTVTVGRDSYAEQYCKNNGIPYTYPDSNDWLNH